MTQRPSAYSLGGGLDETTPPMAVPRGRVIGCSNHESVSTGYGRVEGYERYDGRPGPTAAYLAASEGTAIEAREARRAQIQQVPGSGPVRGVAVFEGAVYAWRDNAGQTAGVMHKATPAGWAPVPLAFSATFTSGSAEPAIGQVITGASSGKTATLKRIVTTSGSWTDGTAAGYMVLSGLSGDFTGGEVLNGAAPDFATLGPAPVAQSFPPGGRYVTTNTNFYGAANRRELYGANGVGRGFAFDGDTVIFIQTGMVDDRPNRVAAFKRHLFFAFPGGSVQHSGPGEPLLWQAIYGAGEIAAGSDVTDFVVGTDALHILSIDQINALTGNDAQDWLLQPLNNEEGHGAIAFAAQTIGAPLYLDIGGFRSISSTQAYGNFRIGSSAPQIKPTLDAKRPISVVPVASLVTKSKDQYRLFFSDGSGISLYFGRKYPEPMLFNFPIVLTCCCSTVNALGERAWAGAEDGYVYQLDTGTSFDGAKIAAYLQLPWDNEGSPDLIKRFHKVIIEMKAAPDTTIGMFAEFDYADGEQSALPQQSFNVSGGGGLWDTVNWDEFYWSAPAEGRAEAFFDGQGENMSVVIVSDSAEQAAYTLGAVRKKITIRGQKR